MATSPFFSNFFAGNDTPYNNANTLMSVGLGLLSGKTANEQVGNAASNFANDRQMMRTANKTIELLKTQNPELAQAVESGVISPLDAYKAHLESQKPKNNFTAVGKNLYNYETGEWVTPPAGIGGDDVEAGLNLVYGQDAEGNTVGFQPLKSGGLKKVDVPDGIKLTPGTSSVDLGTSIGIRDNKSGVIIRQVPKDIAGAAAQKELGEAQGKNAAAASGDLQAGQNAKSLIQELRNDPNRERGTGFSSLGNVIPGTAGYDYENKVSQAKSGAFLTAIQQMRGLGALSNAEGATATAAVTRMDTATSEKAFQDALNDYERIIDQGIARAQSRLGGGQAQPTMQPQNGGQTKSGVSWSVE